MCLDDSNKIATGHSNARFKIRLQSQRLESGLNAIVTHTAERYYNYYYSYNNPSS